VDHHAASSVLATLQVLLKPGLASGRGEREPGSFDGPRKAQEACALDSPLGGNSRSRAGELRHGRGHHERMHSGSGRQTVITSWSALPQQLLGSHEYAGPFCTDLLGPCLGIRSTRDIALNRKFQCHHEFSGDTGTITGTQVVGTAGYTPKDASESPNTRGPGFRTVAYHPAAVLPSAFSFALPAA